jgi:hypothetical protein
VNLRKYALIWVVGTFLLTACGFVAPDQVTPTRLEAEPTATLAHPGFTSQELATLQSLEQVDDYPLYRMVYEGDFPPMSEVPAPLGETWTYTGRPWACSLFVSLADPNNRVYGRNFDWEYSPALLLFSNPDSRYASVAMVDIAYLGYTGDKAQGLADLPIEALESLLYAPWLPFDGMNEMGLVVGMAAVPDGGMQFDPHKATIGSLAVIREILDRAADVEGAVEILRSYNLDFKGGPPLHYLLADRHGQAALVEFYQGEMHVIPNQESWHQATNFLVSSLDDPAGECWRYDAIQEAMTTSNGSLRQDQSMDLLARVSQGNTQWSVSYHLDSGSVWVAMGRDFNDLYRDLLTMEGP